MTTKLLIIEDNDDCFAWALDELAKRQKDGDFADFELASCERVNPSSLSGIRDRVKSLSGHVALVLDLGLDMATIADTVTRLVKEEYNLEFPNEIRLEQREGFIVAHEIICNKSIVKGLIFVATNRGWQSDCEQFLQRMIEIKGRENEVKVWSSSYTLTDRLPPRPTDFNKRSALFDELKRKWNGFFGSPFNSFRQALATAGDIHPKSPTEAHQVAVDMLLPLLAMNVDEFNEHIWTPWKTALGSLLVNNQSPLLEAFKTFGSRDGLLSPIVGWFLALGAYRFTGNPEMWRDVFDPRDLYNELLPFRFSLVPAGAKRQEQIAVMECIFDMCARLFDKEQRPTSSLKKVTMHPESGLAFELDFQPHVAHGGRESLIRQIAQQRNKCLDWDDSHVGVGETSRAIWRCYLATSVCAAGISTDPKAVFRYALPENDPETRFWRLNIINSDTGTKGLVLVSSQQPTAPVVAIIDIRNSDRRTEMANAFQDLDCLVVVYLLGERGLVPNTQPPPQTSYLLTLWHAGDAERSVPPEVSSALVVYYGGDGGHDSRIPKNATRIWRPVLGKQDCLNKDEARELLIWAREQREGSPHALRPLLLEPPRRYSLLPALSILCQAYLSVHAIPLTATAEFDENETDEKDREIVERALLKMEWNQLSAESLPKALLSPETRRQHRKGNSIAEIRSVRSPSWWLEVFANDADLVTDAQLEWGGKSGFERVKPLLLEIVSDVSASKEIPPGKVAEALLALRDRLQ